MVVPDENICVMCSLDHHGLCAEKDIKGRCCCDGLKAK